MDNKWNWTTPATGEPTAEQKERGGMTALLIMGLILTAGGLFFAFKIGAFDLEYFWGMDYNELRYRHKDVLEFSMIFHAPWLIGVLMSGAAIKYFWKHRKK